MVYEGVLCTLPLEFLIKENSFRLLSEEKFNTVERFINEQLSDTIHDNLTELKEVASDDVAILGPTSYKKTPTPSQEVINAYKNVATYGACTVSKEGIAKLLEPEVQEEWEPYLDAWYEGGVANTVLDAGLLTPVKEGSGSLCGYSNYTEWEAIFPQKNYTKWGGVDYRDFVFNASGFFDTASTPKMNLVTCFNAELNHFHLRNKSGDIYEIHMDVFWNLSLKFVFGIILGGLYVKASHKEKTASSYNDEINIAWLAYEYLHVATVDDPPILDLSKVLNGKGKGLTGVSTDSMKNKPKPKPKKKKEKKGGDYEEDKKKNKK